MSIIQFLGNPQIPINKYCSILLALKSEQQYPDTQLISVVIQLSGVYLYPFGALRRSNEHMPPVSSNNLSGPGVFEPPGAIPLVQPVVKQMLPVGYEILDSY